MDVGGAALNNTLSEAVSITTLIFLRPLVTLRLSSSLDSHSEGRTPVNPDEANHDSRTQDGKRREIVVGVTEAYDTTDLSKLQFPLISWHTPILLPPCQILSSGAPPVPQPLPLTSSTVLPFHFYFVTAVLSPLSYRGF